MVGALVELTNVAPVMVKSPEEKVSAGEPPCQVPPLICRRMPAGMTRLASLNCTAGPAVRTMSIGVVAPAGRLYG